MKVNSFGDIHDVDDGDKEQLAKADGCGCIRSVSSDRGQPSRRDSQNISWRELSRSSEYNIINTD